MKKVHAVEKQTNRPFFNGDWGYVNEMSIIDYSIMLITIVSIFFERHAENAVGFG